MIRYSLIILALLSLAGAAWRALIALQHYRSSLAIGDDPSMRELEQVSAFLEGGFSLILLVHGVAFFNLTRRRLFIRWSYALGIAAVCAIAASGSLLGAPIISVTGVYPAMIVAGVAVLSRYLVFDWLSLYLGAVIGSTAGWYVGAPSADAFVCLSVIGPCVILTFAGAGLRLPYLRLATSRS